MYLFCFFPMHHLFECPGSKVYWWQIFLIFFQKATLLDIESCITNFLKHAIPSVFHDFWWEICYHSLFPYGEGDIVHYFNIFPCLWFSEVCIILEDIFKKIILFGAYPVLWTYRFLTSTSTFPDPHSFLARIWWYEYWSFSLFPRLCSFFPVNFPPDF